MTAYRIVYETPDGTRDYFSSDGELMIFDSLTGAQRVIDNTPDIPPNAQVVVHHTSQNEDNEKERARAEQEEREREEREQEEKKRAEAEQEKREREREREREEDFWMPSGDDQGHDGFRLDPETPSDIPTDSTTSESDSGGWDTSKWRDFGWENGG